MPALWITNARVIDPASKREAIGDLFVVDGKIAASLSAADKKRAKKIDAKGLIACPGLVDIHVHFREPGQEYKEDIRSGLLAAAVRAQPIALTALAAMIGAFFILDDPIFNGLAISLIFGIAVTTLLTLVVIPVLYYAVYRKRYEALAA